MAIIKGKLLKDAITELKECNKKDFPTPKVLEVLEFMEKKKMFVTNYEDKHKGNIGKEIKKLNIREIKAELTYIYEEDKKHKGILVKAYEKGILLALFERMYKLQLAMTTNVAKVI